MKLNELEIKIKMSSAEHFHAIYGSCNKLFGPPISHVLQLDEYYDTEESAHISIQRCLTPSSSCTSK